MCVCVCVCRESPRIFHLQKLELVCLRPILSSQKYLDRVEHPNTTRFFSFYVACLSRRSSSIYQQRWHNTDIPTVRAKTGHVRCLVSLEDRSRKDDRSTQRCSAFRPPLSCSHRFPFLVSRSSGGSPLMRPCSGEQCRKDKDTKRARKNGKLAAQKKRD